MGVKVRIQGREDSKYHDDDDIMIPGPQTGERLSPLFQHSLNLISAVP